jgi:hypothetical protein
MDAEGGSQVSDGDSSTTISDRHCYRDDITDGHVGDGKNTYRWEACNLRVVTGLGWASSVWLRAGTADRHGSRRRPKRAAQARYWHSRIGETLTRYL